MSMEKGINVDMHQRTRCAYECSALRNACIDEWDKTTNVGGYNPHTERRNTTNVYTCVHNI
jgi:hypothetical protein